MVAFALAGNSACAQHATPRALDAQRAAFFGGTPIARNSAKAQPSRTSRFEVKNFKFLKDLGLKKPAFLPDFGLEKRKAVLDTFYTSLDAATLSPIVADDLKLYEADQLQPFGKQEWLKLLNDHVKPAIPDFSWSHATTGEKDEDGYSIVKVQAVGHHSGKAFTLPGGKYPPVEPSGKRFRLDENTIKVKVEDGQVKEVRSLPLKDGAGPLALYKALGGKV